MVYMKLSHKREREQHYTKSSREKERDREREREQHYIKSSGKDHYTKLSLKNHNIVYYPAKSNDL